MEVLPECLPCFERQAMDTVKLAESDPGRREAILREVIGAIGQMDYRQSPPEMAGEVHRLIRRLTGNSDPYLEIKRQFNDMALEMLPLLRREIAAADDPLDTILRLVIAGNTIDFGIKSHLSAEDVHDAIEDGLREPFEGNVREFERAANQAESILYLADNAGEIVFDMMLIEHLGPEKITVVVKGSPILNDATLEDAWQVGLTKLPGLAGIIDNGHDAPGTVLDRCRPEFVEQFNHAGLVISKGQGNFETLHEVNKNIYFLLKCKCPVVCRELGRPMGSLILKGQLSAGASTAESLE